MSKTVLNLCTTIIFAQLFVSPSAGELHCYKCRRCAYIIESDTLEQCKGDGCYSIYYESGDDIWRGCYDADDAIIEKKKIKSDFPGTSYDDMLGQRVIYKCVVNLCNVNSKMELLAHVRLSEHGVSSLGNYLLILCLNVILHLWLNVDYFSCILYLCGKRNWLDKPINSLFCINKSLYLITSNWKIMIFSFGNAEELPLLLKRIPKFVDMLIFNCNVNTRILQIKSKVLHSMWSYFHNNVFVHKCNIHLKSSWSASMVASVFV